MKSISIQILIILSLVCLLAYSVVNYWSLPEVHTDIKNNCVRVINNSNTHYDCENMPKKYINYIVRV